MTFQKILAIVCLTAVVMSSGCASIVSKSSYPVTITSTPPGATFVVKNETGQEMHKAQTPATVTLEAGDGYFSRARYSVEFQKDGYQNTVAPLQPTLDPWYIGNLLIGGLLGMLIVDPITGAMWELDQNLLANLAVAPGAVAATPTTVAPAVVAAPVVVTGTAPAAEPAAAGTAEKSVVDRLKELKQLKDAGIISAEEYELKRAPLVEQL